MSRVRKYVLIPQNELATKIHLQNQPAEATEAVQQKTEMNQLLKSNMPIDIKSKLFADMIQSYQTLLDQVKQQQKQTPSKKATSPPPPSPKEDAAQLQLPNVQDVDADAAANPQYVPRRRLKPKAQALFDTLAPDLRINEHGEIENYRGRFIAGSRIDELVSYAVTPKSFGIVRQTPSGWLEFKQILRRNRISPETAPGLKPNTSPKITKTRLRVRREQQQGRGRPKHRIKWLTMK